MEAQPGNTRPKSIPTSCCTYGVTLTQVVNAVQNSNANAGGNYLTMGSQSVNVRGVGLLQSLHDMRNIVIAERNGVPVYLRDVADVQRGLEPRLGKVGVNHDPDIVEGIVLLQRGEKSLPALAALHAESERAEPRLSAAAGHEHQTLYDRTNLINLTTTTVRHIVLMGLMLVTLVLIVFLGDWSHLAHRGADHSCSLLFAFSMMVLTGSPRI